MSYANNIIVIDGYDCSGKTSLAKRVAEYTGGHYVKPFHGTLGWTIVWLSNKGRYLECVEMSSIALEKAIEAYSEGDILVFDRHWVTMYANVPREYRPELLQMPPTIICWTTLENTIERNLLKSKEMASAFRNNDCNGLSPDQERERDDFFVRRYRQLATEYAIPLIDTSSNSPNDVFEQAISFLGISR